MTEKAHLERKILLEINQKKKQHRKQMQSCIWQIIHSYFSYDFEAWNLWILARR